jgi:transposase
MYRDPVQWTQIRKRIIKEGASIRQISRETGITGKTIRKILNHSSPPLRKVREFTHPRLGPHTSTIHRLLEENATLPPMFRLSIRAMHEHLQSTEGFSGGYSTVKEYVAKTHGTPDCIWSYAYDLITSLDRPRAIDFMFMLSRVEPPIICERKIVRFVHRAQGTVFTKLEPTRREKERIASFDWMHAVLQNSKHLSQLHGELGDFDGRDDLIRSVREGNLPKRNKALAVLAARRGIQSIIICEFLGINKHSFQKYRRAFDKGGHTALLARKTIATRKIDDDKLKQAIFGLLHAPPERHGKNRTSWKMEDFAKVLSQRGSPACPEVIRKITRAAGYKWRKARIVLTSRDPDYRAKVAEIQETLSRLGPDEVFFSIDEFGPFAVKAKPGTTLTAGPPWCCTIITPRKCKQDVHISLAF